MARNWARAMLTISFDGLLIVAAAVRPRALPEDPVAGDRARDRDRTPSVGLGFSGEAGGIGVKLVLLGLFGLFVLAVGLVVLGAEQSMRISATLLRPQGTTAEIRIRASFLLLALFVVLAAAPRGGKRRTAAATAPVTTLAATTTPQPTRGPKSLTRR